MENPIYIIKNCIRWTRFILYRLARSLKDILLFKEKKPSPVSRTFADADQQVFFGYYDISPFSSDETLLLAMHAPIDNVSPRPDSEVRLGFYKLNDTDSHFFEIGNTTTWCWQQGCRLQWYPQNSNTHILYNRVVEGQYGCVIQDINSKEIIKEYNTPVYSVSRDGRWGLTLNFSRLQRMRPGYGYVNFPDETEGQLAPEEDGIWKIDMETGEKTFLFSVAEITQLEPLESMKGAEHYFNHILFNPTGSRFMLLHLWGNNGKRFSRLITCNIDGSNRYLLINEERTSHYTWKSDDELLVYSSHPDTGVNYNLYTDRSAVRKVIGGGILTEDGHPSFLTDGSYLLTDAYPDKLRDHKLLLYNLNNEKLTCIYTFFSPWKFTAEVRCDLHPRLSPSEDHVCVDSAHEGKRVMYIVDLHNYIISQKGD